MACIGGGGISSYTIRRPNLRKRACTGGKEKYLSAPGSLRIHLQDMLEAAGKAFLLAKGLPRQAQIELQAGKVLGHHAFPQGSHPDLLPHSHGHLRVHKTRLFSVRPTGRGVALEAESIAGGHDRGRQGGRDGGNDREKSDERERKSRDIEAGVGGRAITFGTRLVRCQEAQRSLVA